LTTQFVTSKDGTRIAYETAGSGPTLLIVNGAMGYRGLGFAKSFRAEMAKHFTVIDYDRRGRGESGDTPPYSVKKEVEDLAALVAGPGGGKCLVFAQSSGAALALEAAASGVPMTTLFAYEPPYMVGDPKDRPAPDFKERLERLVAEGDRSGAVSFFMRTVGAPAAMVAVMRLFPFWKQLAAVAHTLPYDAAVMAGFDFPAKRLAALKVPVVAIAGEKTTPTLKAAVAEVARTVPGARHQMAPKMGHAVNAKRIAPLLRSWSAA
jgi:pimeloyl-ACP methyl ester carboxylesterase